MMNLPLSGDDKLLKAVFAIARRPDLSETEFWERWHVQHAALARKFALVVGLEHYVQSRSIAAPSDFLPGMARGAVFEGIAEGWFSERVFSPQASADNRAGVAFESLLQDERGFLDHTKCIFTLTEEHPVFECDPKAGGGGSITKVVIGHRKKDGAAQIDLEAFLMEEYPDFIRQIAADVALQRLVICLCVRPEISAQFASERNSKPGFDAVSEMYFQSGDLQDTSIKTHPLRLLLESAPSTYDAVIDRQKDCTFLLSPHDIL